MQIREVMKSYTQQKFDQIRGKKISQPIGIRNVLFFVVKFSLICATI